MTASERRPEWRVRYARRLFAVLCSCVLVLGVIEPPKAYAIAGVDDAYMIISAYLQACGLSWGLSNTVDKEQFSQAVSDLVYGYTSTISATATDWLGTIANASFKGGKLYLTKAQIGQISDFVNWLIGDKGITAGGSPVTLTSTTLIYDANGTAYSLTNNSSGTWEMGTNILPAITTYPYVMTVNFSQSSYVEIHFDSSTKVYIISFLNGVSVSKGYVSSFDYANGYLSFYVDSSGILGLANYWYKNGSIYSVMTIAGLNGITASDYSKESSITITPAQALDVPDTSTLADDDTVALDVGAASTATEDDVLSKIWEAIQAGTLAVTTAIEKVQPTEGEVTDVEGLGLPALGAALKSRFPFSIPWDFVGAVKLLAAPAQTPYWHVDLLQPIQARYGILNGDTSITIDLGEYPFIGEVSRWISTFFFGVGLMMATKKLIWTT